MIFFQKFWDELFLSRTKFKFEISTKFKFWLILYHGTYLYPFTFIILLIYYINCVFYTKRDKKQYEIKILLGLSPVRLHHLVDLSPITISEATNMALVVEIFRKLGCRQAFGTVKKHVFFSIFVSKKSTFFKPLASIGLLVWIIAHFRTFYLNISIYICTDSIIQLDWRIKEAITEICILLILDCQFWPQVAFLFGTKTNFKWLVRVQHTGSTWPRFNQTFNTWLYFLWKLC